MASTATVRRPRGGLEDLVRETCDLIVAGAIEGEGPWTTHRLGKVIADRYPGSGVHPSTGAIGDTLKRWSQIGFANITDTSPLAFLSFTDDAADVGLSELKTRHRKRQYAERKAARAAAAPAPAEGPFVPADDHDGHTVVIEDSGFVDGEAPLARSGVPVAEPPAPTGEAGPHDVESWSEPESA